VTPEQHLETGCTAASYIGETSAMQGGQASHSLIVVNVVSGLRRLLRSTPHLTFISGMRTQAGSALYLYPDAIVVCGKPQYLDARQDVLLNPTLVVEVLSPSTESFDRGRKFAYYRTIDSLQDYLMVSSERISAELYTRQPDGRWVLTAADQPRDSIEIPSIGCILTLAALYEKVDFPTPEP